MKPLLVLVGLAATETILAHVLAAWGFGGKLLSMGAHTPAWAILLGLAFVVLRVALVVLGPGAFAVFAIVAVGAARRAINRARRTSRGGPNTRGVPAS